MAQLQRLIRFLAHDGRIYYGNALESSQAKHIQQAHVVQGSIFKNPVVTTEVLDVKRLLTPLARNDVRCIRCIGTNYAKHVEESGLPWPSHPIVFYKPPTSFGGPSDPIPIPAALQDNKDQESDARLDFEGELVVVIGRAARNVRAAEALDYVLGYTVGNDVSSRQWQFERGSQWTMGKGFDGWAPIGPAIVKPSCLPNGNAQALRLTSRVNGIVEQDSSTSDMIFDIPTLVAYCSQGTTLQPGDLIFTGTPPGVRMGHKQPNWLRLGDQVEVHIDGIGTISNILTKEEDVNGSI